MPSTLRLIACWARMFLRQYPTATTPSAVELSPRPRSRGKYFQYAAFVLILVACSGVDDWWHENRAVATERSSSRAPIAASLTPVVAGSSAVVPVAAAPSKQDDAVAPAGSKVELALTATEDTWLSVSSDGTQIFSGLLEANQTKTIEGKQFAKLRVGNAAGLEVQFNGKSLGPLGAHGQVRDLVFTSGKFQFVSPREGERVTTWPSPVCPLLRWPIPELVGNRRRKA